MVSRAVADADMEVTTLFLDIYDPRYTVLVIADSGLMNGVVEVPEDEKPISTLGGYFLARAIDEMMG